MPNVIQELTGEGKYLGRMVRIINKTRGNTTFNRFKEQTGLSDEDLKARFFRATIHDGSSKSYKISISARQNDYYLFDESDLRLANGNNYYEES